MDETAQQPQNTSPYNPPPTNPPGETSAPPLVYEEIPEVVAEPPVPAEPQSPPVLSPIQPEPVKKQSGSCLKTIGTVIIIVVLVAAGIWLSSFVRQFLPSGLPNLTATPKLSPSPTVSSDPFALWKTYVVVSSMTKRPIDGLSFKLPPNVLAPTCDGLTCISQGTYLPGGTRFTVAARGAGQALKDFRGTVITDANGVPLPSNQIMLGTMTVTVYESSASGTTVSGYSFAQMRGAMVPLSDTLSVEVNHFAPSGIQADFASDDTLFDQIITTFTYTGASVSATPTTASSSGQN